MRFIGAFPGPSEPPPLNPLPLVAMTDPLNPMPNNLDEEGPERERDLTVDLTLDESEAIDDLQALADEAAEDLPETPIRQSSRQND